jgi:hypothetical protein
MIRWPVFLSVILSVCGCQLVGGHQMPVSDVPCPDVSPCDDADAGARSNATLASNRSFIPGCPTTLQVMLRPIVFQAVRPDPATPSSADDGDLGCDAPEPPLLRARLDPTGVRPGREPAWFATNPDKGPPIR